MDFVKITDLMLHLCLIDFEDSPTQPIYFAKISVIAVHCKQFVMMILPLNQNENLFLSISNLSPFERVVLYQNL